MPKPISFRRCDSPIRSCIARSSATSIANCCVGVTQRQIDCIEQGRYEDAAFNPAEKALLAFGREVIENVRVSEPVFAAMRKHFSEQEIVESILAIGFYMTMARLTEVTEVDLDPAAGMSVFEGGQKRSG
jgi:hypothetical protein